MEEKDVLRYKFIAAFFLKHFLHAYDVQLLK